MIRRWEVVYRLLARVQHRDAGRPGAPVTVGGAEVLLGRRTGLLYTFRASGKAVPTPLWFAPGDGGRLYASTAPDSGKVKRIRRNPRVLLVPSTTRGRPLGPAVEATARVLPAGEEQDAERALASHFGLLRSLYRRYVVGEETPTAYLELTLPG